MRVVFGCSMGGSGHLLPLLDVADVCHRLGHDIAFLVPPSMAALVSTPGARVVTGAQPPSEFVTELWQRVREGPPEQVVGLLDRELFAGRATDAMRAPARVFCEEFMADLVVREPCEYATAMAAHELGLPQMQVAISRAEVEAAVLKSVADGLDHRCRGVAGAIWSAPFLTAFAASLDPSSWPDTRRFRAECAVDVSPLPDWWPGLGNKPLVYVTFGSVLGGVAEAHDVYRAALQAVAHLPVRVLLTVGRRFDLKSLGAVPPNTHVERWVPQADVFAAAQVVVCHGGSGTTNGALAVGIPMVICPLFADQDANAVAINRVGAALVVRSSRPTLGGVGTLDGTDASTLASAIKECLRDDRYRQAAQSVASIIRSTPTLTEVVRTVLRNRTHHAQREGA